MTQFSIFHSIAESNINSLVDMLNQDLKSKEQYSLVLAENIPNNEVLISASNGKDYVFNIVNQDGNVPNGNVVNWRNASVIFHEFGNEIPEPVVRIRIMEINQNLKNKGYDWDYIENFWNDVFKECKK